MTSTDLLGRFVDCPVLVIGDLMLDEFVWGQVTRISPEAPVPVVEVQRRTFTPGGAANTAANIGSLGGKPLLAGLVGDDPDGSIVDDLLRNAGVGTSSLVRDPARPTTKKTRVVAHNQQVVRIDHERPGPMTEALAETLLGRIEAVLPEVRAVVVSDYGKGVATPSFLARLFTLTRSAGLPVVVDPKGTDFTKYRGATLVKPNQLEAGLVLNQGLRTDADIDQAGKALVELLDGESAVLITRGSHGMSLFAPGQPRFHVPAQAREVFDVTGAGDTVAGTIALALGVGADLGSACRLASLAAAIVVGKIGTAVCTLDELKIAQQVARW